jgi:hypothetical protein
VEQSAQIERYLPQIPSPRWGSTLPGESEFLVSKLCRYQCPWGRANSRAGRYDQRCRWVNTDRLTPASVAGVFFVILGVSAALHQIAAGQPTVAYIVRCTIQNSFEGPTQ